MGSVSGKQTLIWSKTGSVDSFLIIQFNSEVYCDIIKLLLLNCKNKKSGCSHSELLLVNS